MYGQVLNRWKWATTVRYTIKRLPIRIRIRRGIYQRFIIQFPPADTSSNKHTNTIVYDVPNVPNVQYTSTMYSLHSTSKFIMNQP